MSKKVLVAGATGNLGGKIVDELINLGADVMAIVRQETDDAKIEKLINQGVKVHMIDMSDVEEIAQHCEGVDCFVSALSGLREVIIDTQSKLLAGAVMAKVPRFIPSDYAIDFTSLKPGQNRNLDMRRDFHVILDKQPIQATSIFNGAFMELLTGEMPLIIKKYNRILAWGNPDQKMDMTTTFNIAAFTARVALDNDTPRYMHIAGSSLSSKDYVGILSELTKHPYKTFRAGGIGFFNILIKITKVFASGENELYPPWQGMQYMRDMMEGRVKVPRYWNDRYPDIQWTSSKEYLKSHF